MYRDKFTCYVFIEAEQIIRLSTGPSAGEREGEIQCVGERKRDSVCEKEGGRNKEVMWEEEEEEEERSEGQFSGVVKLCR